MLLLRDVLALRAAEVADGARHVGRRGEERAAAGTGDGRDAVAGAGRHRRRPRPAPCWTQYVKAFENADAAALERLLTEDAVLEMTGVRTWFAGKATCLPHLRAQALGARATGG